MSYAFWIDRGGTFTDVIARAPDGTLITRKYLSENPTQYADAAVAAMRDILSERGEIAAEGQNKNEKPLDPRVSLRSPKDDKEKNDPSLLPPLSGEGKSEAPFPAHLVSAIKMGTTVATNALLTREGTPTVFAVTQGFADSLRIGTQNRPRIFDLKITLPEMLYAKVVEIPERVSATGEVVRALDEGETRARLQAAHDSGLRCLAVTLMHGYRFTAHELRVAEIAREIGYTHISMSHAVSPLMKLVARGDTTVADAYLSPVLRRYVAQVQGRVNGTRLLFMQSNGGLAEASHFHGKDAVLSGPAGGVVGAAETARAAGFNRIIGFDMGGTSTDVCHFAGGDYERSFETVVAGVRLRAPMMQVHTIAAGGGSLLVFDGLRFRVGPESAGANPGPACYGKGGPLTVTDANVLLGKINPAHFPKVFGASGKEALDAGVVRAKFEALAAGVKKETGQAKPPEELAQGFLALAVDNMARAIRKISVERGHDVTAYALACFGGAGGQHACLVADALGMKTVYIHPLAGVLSAYGIGLAALRAVKERTVEAPLDDARVGAALEELAKEAKAALSAQGVAAGAMEVQKRVHLKYAGTDTALAVAHGDASAMTAAFMAAHKAQFGFVMDGRKLVCDMAVVEAVERTSNPHPAAPPHPSPQGGGIVKGPAVIPGALATTVVEPGWQAEERGDGALVLTKESPPPQPLPTRGRGLENKNPPLDGEGGREATGWGEKPDPLRIEIFNNLFMSIAEQMGAVLQNTAQSVNIKERLDFSCAVFDGAGNLLANAPHMPVHLGSMGESVRSVMRRHKDMKDGDAFVLNNPYDGGTHLPDITVVTPVFLKGAARPMFFTASRGHHADVGGATPGSMPPDSKTLADEGVLLDNLVMIRGGVFQEAEVRAALGAKPHPARNIEMNLADLRAQAAANAKGAAELLRTVGEFGREVVTAYVGHVQDHAEEAVRRVIGELKSGSFTCPMDDGGVIKVAVTVDAKLRAATVDFTGTSAQRPNNFNAPSAICRAAALYVFRTLIEGDIPMNEGVLRPLTLVIPEGSMLKPRFPAAVVAGNVETSQIICDALYGALGKLAACQGTMNNFTFGNARHQYYETICGGAGAGANFDGTDAVHTHMTNSRLTDPEVLEWRFPVRVEQFAIRKNSGGAGRHKGGDGAVRTLTFLEPMTAAILSGRRASKPFGLAGGGDALAGETVLTRKEGGKHVLGPTEQVSVAPGDAITVSTPGGGGYGKA